MSNLPIKTIKKLYYKSGLSAREVGEKLGVSASAIYKFMRRNKLLRRTFKENNQMRFSRKPLSFSVKKNLSRRDRELKMAGIMLYWTEGAKYSEKSCTVDFVNSNSKMIELFLKFLHIICGIDRKRLRVLLYCYANQDVESLKLYWNKITNIPFSQFTKPYIRKDFLLEKSGKMKYGLVHIRYGDKKLLLQIEKWINDYLKRIL